jgi:hypothetical protein
VGFGFKVTTPGTGKTGPAAFPFAVEDGTISRVSFKIGDSSHSFLVKDTSQDGNGAVYKGLAVATSGGQNAANFRSGEVEGYNTAFRRFECNADLEGQASRCELRPEGAAQDVQGKPVCCAKADKARAGV